MKVFKVEYFKNSSFLEGNLGRRPSQVWKSLFWGHEMFVRGVIWRNGDGKLVRCMEIIGFPSRLSFIFSTFILQALRQSFPAVVRLVPQVIDPLNLLLVLVCSNS